LGRAWACAPVTYRTTSPSHSPRFLTTCRSCEKPGWSRRKNMDYGCGTGEMRSRSKSWHMPSAPTSDSPAKKQRAQSFTRVTSLRVPLCRLRLRELLPHDRCEHWRLNQLLEVLVVGLEPYHQFIGVAVNCRTVDRGLFRGRGIHFLEQNAGLQD
jgi:hypothetical protein